MATARSLGQSAAAPRRFPTRQRPVGRLPSLVASTLGTPALTRLPPRLQEIATIVYLHTNVTAKDLESALGKTITNSAIRCMLGRLVAKGILRRHEGQGKTFVYSPAIVLPDIQDRAIERLADDYFGGCLDSLLRHAEDLVRRRDPDWSAGDARDRMRPVTGSLDRDRGAASIR